MVLATPMMYIFPMMLGATFDMQNYRTGISLFPLNELAFRETLRKPGIPENKVFIMKWDEANFVEIPNDLALKVKAGYIDWKPAGDFINEFGMTKNTTYLVFSIRTLYFTNYLSFGVKPFSNWTDYEKNDLGTHYVGSMTYGSDLFVSFAIRMLETTNTNNVSIDTSLINTNVTLENLVEIYEELRKDLHGIADIKVSFISNIPFRWGGFPQTLGGLKSAIKLFKSKFIFPVEVGLVSLSTLDDRFNFKKNEVLMTHLRAFEYKFDDLRRAKRFTMEWMRTVSSRLQSEQKRKINKYLDRVNTVLMSFLFTIKRLNVENGPEQLDKSVKAYFASRNYRSRNYVEEFDKLSNAINKELQQE